MGLSERTQDLLEKTPNLPQSYEFVRMRFLLGGQAGYSGELIPLGRLLLKKKPNDVEIKFELSKHMIDSTRTKADRKAALEYVLRLKKQYPAEKIRVRVQLADIYMRLANMGEDPTAQDKEIAIYEEILKDYRRRKQMPKVKEAISSVMYRLKAARKYKKRNT